MFMVLSSWQGHCESFPGWFDECRTAPGGRRPLDQANHLRCRRRSARKPWKSTFSITPLSFDASSPGNPREYPLKLTFPETMSHWATSSSPIVWVYLHSHFRGGLRMTHVLWNRVHNGPSKSSKVVDFGTNRKRVWTYYWSLVISGNLGLILGSSGVSGQSRPSSSTKCKMLQLQNMVLSIHHKRDIAGFLLWRATPPEFWGLPLGLNSPCGSEDRRP